MLHMHQHQYHNNEGDRYPITNTDIPHTCPGCTSTIHTSPLRTKFVGMRLRLANACFAFLEQPPLPRPSSPYVFQLQAGTTL